MQIQYKSSLLFYLFLQVFTLNFLLVDVKKYLLSERMGRIGGREGYKGRVMKRVFCFGHRKMWIYIVLQSLISFMIPWMSQRLRSLNLKQGGNIIFLKINSVKSWISVQIFHEFKKVIPKFLTCDDFSYGTNSLFLAIEKIPQKNKEEEGLGGKTKINSILYSRYSNEAKTRA